jgi:beta-lactamase class A
VDAAGTAIKPTSAFAIASTTKTFVAAEVLPLVSAIRPTTASTRPQPAPHTTC